MNILIIDNNDSFTYNLLHLVEQFANADVVRVYDLIVEDLSLYDGFIISPGPGKPSDYIKLKHFLDFYSEKKPILGICLGHQAIAEYFGGELFNLDEVDHGIEKRTIVCDSAEIIFKDVPAQFFSGRYHSWAVSTVNFPKCLKITATDGYGLIMGISHMTLNIRGLQFHPESVMTPIGKTIIQNWIQSCIC